MDPDQALSDIREHVAAIQHAESTGAACDAGDRLAESVGALDRWLSSGGFLPAAWGRSRR